MEHPGNKAAWIKDLIESFILESPENTLENNSGDKAFAAPLAGFSNGADPLFKDFKKHVGPFHLTPTELFSLTFNDFDIQPGELTVISWILPHIKATRSDNRKETFYPSERWARGRIFGEKVNEKLRNHVLKALAANGYDAVAPAFTPQFSVRLSPDFGYASTWSERHAAYASGLGTFGLCDGLITAAGKAMRAGSVIARIDVAPTPRPYENHHEYCLHYTHGICGKCIKRCPVEAISETGKNKHLCRDHLFRVTSDHVTQTYGFDGYGCGLCQTKVPCEFRIPDKRRG